MYQPASLQVRVDARFEDIPKVSLGQAVRISNPALAEPIMGTVLFVSSEANIQKNTLQVKVAIDAANEILKPEMLVEVSFLSPKQDAEGAKTAGDARLYVPQQVVQQDQGQSFLWIADQADQAARKLPVTLGHAAHGGLIEVSGSGLNASSRVIARGHEDLEDGQRIRVVSELGDEHSADTPNKSHQSMQRLPAEGN
jgi:multidrug efflux pump subunit AcrA (membrane-fusion protein)